MLRVFILIALVVSAGCGPIEYLTTVSFQASRAVSQARRAGADTLAPYEYTLAVEHLHKAREVAGHSRWQEALRLGKVSLAQGRKAETLAREKALKPDERRE